MSPEQTRGDATDRRTDLWAMGVVIYESVCGRLPFRGTSSEAVSYNVVHTEPEPLTALRSGLPTEIDRIISKALRKDPAARYQNAGDLIVDLRHVGTDRAEKQVWRRWAWVGVAPVLLVAGFFAWRAWRAPESTEPLRAVPLTTLPGVHALSLVFPRRQPRGIYLDRTEAGQSRHLRAADRLPALLCG